jgi:hypothetical protein
MVREKSSLRSPVSIRLSSSSFSGQKKTGAQYCVAGFTICSLIPVVTTWGYQFIASTHAAVQDGLSRLSTADARERYSA